MCRSCYLKREFKSGNQEYYTIFNYKIKTEKIQKLATEEVLLTDDSDEIIELD